MEWEKLSKLKVIVNALRLSYYQKTSYSETSKYMKEEGEEERSVEESWAADSISRK